MTGTVRPLTDEERAQLAGRLAKARTDAAGALLKVAVAGAAVCGALAVATLLASDAPRPVIIGFWTVLWAVLTLWIGLPQRRLMLGQVGAFEEALRANRAREMRVQATRVVEFEEEEDEGACYAFDHHGDVVFIIGQEFYEDDDFPNSDFSIVEILGEHDRPVDALTVKRGRKLQPVRLVPASVKNQLELPEHLAIVPGPLDQIEASLRLRPS